MKKYLFTSVSREKVVPVRQLVGLPPQLNKSSDGDGRKMFPLPSILVIEWDGKRAFLYRFLDEETPCGDTWHQTLKDAFSQVDFEYPDMAGDWKEIPVDFSSSIADAVDYIFKKPL